VERRIDAALGKFLVAWVDGVRRSATWVIGIGILAPDLAQADALAARLRELGSVDRALTLSDSVPADQEAKLMILEDVSLFLGLPIRAELREPPDLAEQIRSVADLRDALLRLQDLTLGIALLLIANLVVLPAMLALADRRSPGKPGVVGPAANGSPAPGTAGRHGGTA
jgi:hypothetical protein